MRPTPLLVPLFLTAFAPLVLGRPVKPGDRAEAVDPVIPANRAQAGDPVIPANRAQAVDPVKPGDRAAPVSIPRFDTVELSLDDPLSQSNLRLVLQASGLCKLFRSSPTARYAPIDGRATPEELSRVMDAFDAADVTTLPRFIPDPRAHLVAPGTETIISTLPDGRLYSTTANEGWYAPFEARFLPLLKSLRAIAARLLRPSFDSITLDWSGGLTLYDTAVTIGSDGSVVVARTGRTSAYLSGQADPIQLQALSDAIRAADLASLPPFIDDPIVVADAPQLGILCTRSGVTSRTIVAEAGYYGVFEARIRPVVEAVEAIERAVVAAGRVVVTDVVRIDAAGRLFVGSHQIDQNDALARLVAAHDGRIVRVTGHSTTSVTGQLLALESVSGRANSTLFLRSQPRSGAGILGVLPIGTEVEVVEMLGGWLLIRAGAESGWVPSQDITIPQ